MGVLSERASGRGRAAPLPAHPRIRERIKKVRRQTARRRIKRYLAFGAAALLLELGAFVTVGPAFSVRSVEVRGASTGEAPEVVAASGVLGRNSLFVSESQLRRAVEARMPWLEVEGVVVRYPGTVVVQVSPTPACAYERVAGGRVRLVSCTGRQIGIASASPRVPEIRGPLPRPARAGGGPGLLFSFLSGLDPRVLSMLSFVEVKGPGVLSGTYSGGEVYWGDASELRAKERVFETAVSASAFGAGQVLDVSVPETPVILPANGPPSPPAAAPANR